MRLLLLYKQTHVHKRERGGTYERRKEIERKNYRAVG